MFSKIHFFKPHFLNLTNYQNFEPLQTKPKNLCETLQDVLSSGDESYGIGKGDEYDRLRSLK